MQLNWLLYITRQIQTMERRCCLRDADLQKFRDGSSPLTHANIDLIDRLFSKGLWNSDNISFAGGGEKGAYNVSLGYLSEGGILKQTGLERYTVRANLDTRISNKLTAGLNLAGTINEIKDPAAGLNWITELLSANGPMMLFNLMMGDGPTRPGQEENIMRLPTVPMKWERAERIIQDCLQLVLQNMLL